jgi:hypothetical protein
MNRADRRQESVRLGAVLTGVRDRLNVLIDHLEQDVLPPRMVAASAHQLMSTAMAVAALATFSLQGPEDLDGRHDKPRGL